MRYSSKLMKSPFSRSNPKGLHQADGIPGHLFNGTGAGLIAASAAGTTGEPGREGERLLDHPRQELLDDY
ncbi:MAG: hypothetical protein ACYDHX_10795 [Methanothrix sp.]